MDYETIPMPDEAATYDNVLVFINGICELKHLDGAEWQHLRSELLKYIMNRARTFPDKELPLIKDVCPYIIPFLIGYMACYDYCRDKLSEVVNTIKHSHGIL